MQHVTEIRPWHRMRLIVVTLVLSTTMALNGSAQPAANPTVQGGPQDITLTTEDGVAIAATFFGTEKRMPPALILVHDWEQDRGGWDTFAREMSAHGIAVLSLDLRGHGESLGTEDQPLSAASLTDGDRAAFPDDVRAGIRFLREREDIDGVRVAVIGAGLGANVAARYATDDHLLVGLGLVSPSIESHGIRSDDAIHAYGKRPVLLIAASADQTSIHALPILEEKAQGDVQVFRVDGAAHGTDLLNQFTVRAKILEWLNGVFAAP